MWYENASDGNGPFGLDKAANEDISCTGASALCILRVSRSLGPLVTSTCRINESSLDRHVPLHVSCKVGPVPRGGRSGAAGVNCFFSGPNIGTPAPEPSGSEASVQ